MTVRYVSPSLVLRLLLLVVAAVGYISAAVAERPTAGTNLQSAKTVDEAVERIGAALTSQGFEIATIINHAAAAASVGLELPPTQVVFFRNTVLEAFALRRSRTVGIDLPLKILVWEDTDGEIRIRYNDAGYLADRHDLRFGNLLLGIVDRVQSQFGELDNGLVSVSSTLSVEDAADALQTALMDAGFRVPLVIDYKADAGYFGRRLKPAILVVAGNPNVGTQLMQADRRVALDLPQKFLIWEARDGSVNVTYNDPVFVAERAGIEGLDTLLGNIAAALARFADAASGS